MFIDVRNGDFTRQGLAGLLSNLTDWRRCYGSIVMCSSHWGNTVVQIVQNVKGGRVGEEGKACDLRPSVVGAGRFVFALDKTKPPCVDHGR